jgi:N-acetylglutamate synthase-like GNAT family acetyltransferase
MDPNVTIRRAKQGDLEAICRLVEQATQPTEPIDEAKVREWLFNKGLWVAVQEDSAGTPTGVAAWQAENLLSVTDVLYVSPVPSWAEVGRQLLETIEAEARTLMCEANVVLLQGWVPETIRTQLQEQGYEPKRLETLPRVWQEVLSDLLDGEPVLMVKRLRDRMVMSPP